MPAELLAFDDNKQLINLPVHEKRTLDNGHFIFCTLYT